jgi:hypothetical protein
VIGRHPATFFVLVSTLTALAHAEPVTPTRDQCFEAYEGGQRSRKKFELIAAQRAFITCAQAKCPADIRKECTAWTAEVDKDIPTIVIVAKDPEGNDLTDVEVRMDGGPFVSKLDGTPLEVDPELHRFRFIPKRGPVLDTSWVMRVGEKGRVFHITLGQPVVKGKPATRARSPLPYVLGGVGVVGLGMFTYFGLHGRSIQSDLDDRGCKPGCPKDEADEMDRSYLIANVSLVVGLAALGGATYLYFSDRSHVGVGLGSVRGRF